MRLRQIARVVLLTLFFCHRTVLVSAGQIVVFAAASLKDSLREIGDSYQRSGPDKIVFNFGGSSTLARQVEEGAPADIFFSADEAQMDGLEAHGLIVSGSRTNLLSNSLVIIVAAQAGVTVRTPQDLAGQSIRRIALGDPKTVPIGVYAKKFLQQTGLWDAVASKIIPTENVRSALAAVEAGNADASIVYKTDALISKQVLVACAIPADKGPPIRYPVAMLKGSQNRASAASFLGYLASPVATSIFERRGFSVLR